jgi:uncharacterized protein (DUF433 family)
MVTDTAVRKSWIQKTPNVCGGDACIRNTRITVHGIVHYRQLGLSDVCRTNASLRRSRD